MAVNSKSALLRLDLKAFSSTEFRLRLPLADDDMSLLRRALGAKSNEGLLGFRFVDRYKRSGAEHELYAHVHEAPRPDSEPQYELVVQYDLEPGDYGDREKAFRTLINVLGKASRSLAAECDLRCVYDLNEWASTIAIPWRLFSGEGMPFDEVLGLRIARKVDAVTIWTMIVDHYGESFSHYLSYSFTAQLNERFFQLAFARGAEISGQLLRRASADGTGQAEDRSLA